MVSVLLLVIVMVVALSLLFTMRSFADRQQFYTAPRQAARRAIDYVSSFAAGAGDLNWDTANNKYDPDALPTQVRFGGKNDTLPLNVAYDNLTGTEYQGITLGGGFSFTSNSILDAGGKYSAYGDVGTDIFTVQIPNGQPRIPIATWNGSAFQAANMYIDWEQGCPDDALNMDLFKQAIGWDSGTHLSNVLTYTDGNGNFYYVQITGPGDLSSSQSSCNASPLYHTSGPTPTCTPGDLSNPCSVIHVDATHGRSDGINPPGGFRPPQIRPLSLGIGLKIYSFRVRTPLDSTGTPCGPPNLEQRTGFFFPGNDACGLPAVGAACGSCPSTFFTPIVEGVEDMQVAWLYAKDPAAPLNGANLLQNTTSVSIPRTLANPDQYDVVTNLNPNLSTMGVPPQIGQLSANSTTTLCTNSLGTVGFPLNPLDLSGYGASTCAYDVRYIRGLRISFTARSLSLPLDASNLRLRSAKTSVGTAFRPDFNFRPAAENHAAAATFDGYDHNKMTTTLMVRNRMLGN